MGGRGSWSRKLPTCGEKCICTYLLLPLGVMCIHNVTYTFVPNRYYSRHLSSLPTAFMGIFLGRYDPSSSDALDLVECKTRYQMETIYYKKYLKLYILNQDEQKYLNICGPYIQGHTNNSSCMNIKYIYWIDLNVNIYIYIYIIDFAHRFRVYA